MTSLARYWLREFIQSIIILVIVVVPFASACMLEGLWRRWLIVIGIVGVIVYYCTEQKVMPSATYVKLVNKQKKIVLRYRLAVCVIFLFLILIIEMKAIFRVFIGSIILYVGYLSTKRLISLRGGKENERKK